MAFETLVFFWFAFWLVFASAGMIMSRNIVRSILLLILSFFSAACLWLLLESEFLAITLILVYVGAIMVLFLFVVMMLDVVKAEKRAKFTGYLPLGIIIAIVVISEISLVLGPEQFGLDLIPAPERHLATYSNVTELALELYTIYAYPFELAAVLLLVAIVSAITLVHREKKQRLVQNIREQVEVKPEDRLKIIKMKTEPKNRQRQDA